MKVYVDASRNRSGGAVEYLLGVFGSEAVRKFPGEIHLFAPKAVLAALSDAPHNVKKRSHWMIERNLAFQVCWQTFCLPALLLAEKANILFSTDASTTAMFKPHVVMSQDLLSYVDNISFSQQSYWRQVRIKVIYRLQNSAFRRATGVIFLTNYASQVVQQHIGLLNQYSIIPHGVSPKTSVDKIRGMSEVGRAIQVVYVSNAAPYKNQWHVIEAVNLVRSLGYDLNLTLVGGGEGMAQTLTTQKMFEVDPEGIFVRQLDFLPRLEVEKIVSECDIYLFASSCENLPITLLEGMALGLPIASSNRGPMPEVLKDGGEYFNPEKPSSIARALVSLIEKDSCRWEKQEKSYWHSKEYCWEKTAMDTLTYLSRFC